MDGLLLLRSPRNVRCLLKERHGGPAGGWRCASALAADEALFSLAEAKLLHLHGGLQKAHDILVFDPVNCYGLPGYIQIVDYLVGAGWPRTAFWPHGGHLFSLHVAAALDLGGSEITPFAFGPFRGLPHNARMFAGRVSTPEMSGIGFEGNPEVWRTFQAL